jgi:hypothetical protein
MKKKYIKINLYLEEEVRKELEQGIMDASDTSLIICQLQ